MLQKYQAQDALQAQRWTSNGKNRLPMNTSAVWKRPSSQSVWECMGVSVISMSVLVCRWMEACLKDELPATTELEETLRTGIILARLGNFFAPERVPAKRIYDVDLARFEQKGLHFKHTDNINHWLNAMRSIGMPQIFFPTTTDIYDRKNMPKCVYCIHALR